MIHLKNRAVVKITGADAANFLQGLVTNDIKKVNANTSIYAAMLSPQGKYLFDFIISDGFFVDIDSARAADFIKRLTMYKLRSAVEISLTDLAVYSDEKNGLPDPRNANLGSRLIAEKNLPEDGSFGNYQLLCKKYKIPDENVLVPEKSYILKHGFEELNGVDFNKGCYVGQEVTARMKYRGNQANN